MSTCLQRVQRDYSRTLPILGGNGWSGGTQSLYIASHSMYKEHLQDMGNGQKRCKLAPKSYQIKPESGEVKMKTLNHSDAEDGIQGLKLAKYFSTEL